MAEFREMIIRRSGSLPGMVAGDNRVEGPWNVQGLDEGRDFLEQALLYDSVRHSAFLIGSEYHSISCRTGRRLGRG